MRRVGEIFKRSITERARTLPTPEIDSRSSKTRIFATASSLLPNSKTWLSENFPFLIWAFTSALRFLAAPALARARARSSGESCGGCMG